MFTSTSGEEDVLLLIVGRSVTQGCDCIRLINTQTPAVSWTLHNMGVGHCSCLFMNLTLCCCKDDSSIFHILFSVLSVKVKECMLMRPSSPAMLKVFYWNLLVVSLHYKSIYCTLCWWKHFCANTAVEFCTLLDASRAIRHLLRPTAYFVQRELCRRMTFSGALIYISSLPDFVFCDAWYFSIFDLSEKGKSSFNQKLITHIWWCFPKGSQIWQLAFSLRSTTFWSDITVMTVSSISEEMAERYIGLSGK